VGIVFLTCAYVSDLRDVFILRISGGYSQEIIRKFLVSFLERGILEFVLMMD